MKEMKEDELESLLQKYYNGETTLPEEKLLKTYLSQNGSSPKLKAEGQWFRLLQQEKQAETSKDFDKRLEEKLEQEALRNKDQSTLRSLFTLPYRMAALLVVALGLSFVVYFTLSRKQSPWVEIATTEKETKEVSLPDGSKVWLNASSTIRYARQLESAAQREVWLEGEAYFEVIYHAQQPFLVHAAGTVTQVLGTSFNVRGYPGQSTAELGVISGKVSFSVQGIELAEKVILQAGNGAVFDKQNTTIQKMERINPNLLAWKTHQLVFEDAPLHEVIVSLERYFAVKIELKNPELADCRFRGNFKEADLNQILEVLKASMNLSALQKEEYYILSGKGCL